MRSERRQVINRWTLFFFFFLFFKFLDKWSLYFRPCSIDLLIVVRHHFFCLLSCAMNGNYIRWILADSPEYSNSLMSWDYAVISLPISGDVVILNQQRRVQERSTQHTRMCALINVLIQQFTLSTNADSNKPQMLFSLSRGAGKQSLLKDIGKNYYSIK